MRRLLRRLLFPHLPAHVRRGGFAYHLAHVLVVLSLAVVFERAAHAYFQSGGIETVPDAHLLIPAAVGALVGYIMVALTAVMVEAVTTKESVSRGE